MAGKILPNSIATPMRKSRYITPSVQRQIWSMPCAVCGLAGDTVIDHIEHHCRGGGSGVENLQPLCSFCNHKKSGSFTNQELIDWFQANKNDIAEWRRLWNSGQINYGTYSSETFEAWRRIRAK